MRTIGLIFAITTLYSTAAVAEVVPGQVLKQAEQLKQQALGTDLGYDIIESLTTEVGPRLAGTEDEARAREWAVNKLKDLGFNDVRTEMFDMPTWLRGEEQAAVVAPFPQPLSITALGGSVATPAEGIEAELVMVKNLYALKALPPGALDGKIVYVGHNMRKTQDGSSYGFTVPLRRDGASEAAKKGAIAALIRSIGTSSHRFPHTGQMRYEQSVKKIPIAAVSAPDADQLERIFKRQQPVKVKLTLTPEMVGEKQSGNVIADIKGSERPEEIVIIGGHLDSWDLGTGAVDDGAGIGITTAAAKLINDFGVKPKRTIRLIHWGAEEVGLLGAKAYAEKHKADIGKHIIASESDFGAGPIWQVTSKVSEDSLPVIKKLVEVLAPLGVGKGHNIGYGGPDLIPLKELGMPGVSLRQDGRDYFDLHHTPDDTLDKIKPEDIRQNVAAYAVFAWMMANVDTDFREKN